MQGVDVSNNQTYLDPAAIEYDFLIAKATQGNSFIDKFCDYFVQNAISRNKCFGVYHYLTGDPNEIDFFIDNIQGYLHKGIIALDYEPNENAKFGDLDYLDSCVKRVIDRTGIKPLIYSSASYYPWSVSANNDCGTWVAQYADNNITGYQTNPWNEENLTCVIRQYSSHGVLNGYDSVLDLDKFYGDVATWNAYASAATPNHPIQLFTPNNTNAQLWHPEWHNGYVVLRECATNRALDITNGDIEQGTIIQAYTPNDTDAQKWVFVQSQGEYNPCAPYELAPYCNQSLRLDCVNGGCDDGTQLQLYEANNTNAQKFAIADKFDGSFSLINVNSMKAVDLVNGGN